MLTPALNGQSPVHALLERSTQIPRTTSRARVDQTKDLYWSSSHYNLDSAQVFQSFNSEQKFTTLHSLNHKSLALSCFIEKFGLNYGAQMVLLAQTTEEKSLYTMFSAEEVRHRLMLEAHLFEDLPTTTDFHPLLKVLEIALEQGNRDALVFVVQVVLEGFGLTHYSALKESCSKAALQAVFSEILKDEVGHHGMGLAIAQTMKHHAESREQITQLTVEVVKALTAAEWVLQAVEFAAGGLTTQQKNDFRSQTQWTQSVAVRMQRLKDLLKKASFHWLIADLEEKGVFHVPA